MGTPDELVASNANVELLDILSDAREHIYFRDVVTTSNGATMVSPKQLQEVDNSLTLWAAKYNIHPQTSDEDLSACTK